MQRAKQYNSFVRRRNFAVACLISLLLFAATVALWARSYHGNIEFVLGTWRMEAWRGRCVLIRHRMDNSIPGHVSVVTAVYFGSDGTAMLTETVCDPASPPWDETDPAGSQNRLKQHLMHGGQLLSRQYLPIQLAPPGSIRNLGGFAGTVVRLDLPKNWSAPPRAWIFEKSDPVLWSAAVPMWFAAMLFAGLPLRYLYHFARDRRLWNSGLCTVCGYDVRASPDRCPECGATVEPKARAAHETQIARIRAV